jgi:Mor family transcriptional regulator
MSRIKAVLRIRKNPEIFNVCEFGSNHTMLWKKFSKCCDYQKQKQTVYQVITGTVRNKELQFY